MSIGDNIRRLREEHGMTQTQLGEIAGVTDKAVSTWESGKKVPRMGAIQKISDHFGISKSELIMDYEELLANEAERQKTISAAIDALGYGVNSVNDRHDIVFRDERRSTGFTENEQPHLLTLFQLNLQGNEKAMRTLRILGELVAVMSPEDQDRLVSYAEFIEAERQKRFGITVVHPYQQGSVTLPEIIDDSGDMPDAETLALARQILQDKKAQDDAPASSGDSGSKKMA